MPPRAVIQQDLSKGTNLVTNPYDINEKQSIRLLNLILDEHGSARTRPGTTIVTTAPDAGRRIVRVFDFVKLDLSIVPLAILRGNPPLGFPVNSLYLRTNSPTLPWTLIGNFLTLYDVPDILTFTDLALIAAGYETPWQYDGTTFSQITDSSGSGVPPGAKHHSVHLGSYWLWNTAAITTTTDGPSCLRSSDVNNPNSWPLANQVFIAKDDGQTGQGLAQFTIAESGISPTDTQIAFKDQSGYQITGVFDADTFSIQRIKSDMGCMAPRTIQFVAGFGILRLTHRGVAQFNGVDDTLVSEEIRPLLFGGGGYTPIDWSNVGLSYAVQVQNPPLYLLFCPTGGPALVRCFCYDLVRQAWSVLQFAVPFSSAQLMLNPNALPIVLVGDYAANLATIANVRRIFGQDTSDDCQAPGIFWELDARAAVSGSAQTNAYWRRSILKVINVVKGQVVNALAIFGSNPTGTPRTIQKKLTCPATVAPTGAGGLGYGLDPWGTSPWGGGVTNSELDLTFDLGLIGDNLRIIYSGVGPITIRGLEHHAQPKPASRPSVYS